MPPKTKIVQAGCTSTEIVLLADNGLVFRAEHIPVAIECDGYLPEFKQEPFFKTGGLLGSGHKVVDIQCGKGHVLFLTKGGQVYAAGSTIIFFLGSIFEN